MLTPSVCADPSQIQIVSNTTHGPASGRHLLQQPASNSSEGANLQIQITPTPDQASPMVLAWMTPSRCLYACRAAALPCSALQLQACRQSAMAYDLERRNAPAEWDTAMQCKRQPSIPPSRFKVHHSSLFHWLSVVLHLQRASVLDALRQPNFSGSLRNSLAAQGACTFFIPFTPNLTQHLL